MGDFDFKLLLHEIRNGNVVPIIGTELYVDEQNKPYDTLITTTLTQSLGVDASKLPPSPTPRDVALAYLMKEGARLSTLRAAVQAVVKEKLRVPPEPLQKLARITDFKLYVTTANDRMMEEALKRANRGTPVSLAYSLKKFDLKLPDIQQSPVPTVCHLLGDIEGEFPLGDADVIEYLQALLSQQYRPLRLYDELQNRNLLFMGCGFPDWLSRLFIRTVKDRPFLPSQAESRAQFIADSRAASEPSLKLFLTHYNVQLSPDISPTAFVDQLYTEWSADQPPPPPGDPQLPPMQPGSVFLSFSSLDREDIREIAKSLETAGIAVFFDETNIERGAEWDPFIIENLIKATLFVPFISRNTESFANEGKYFWREWNLAEERMAFYAHGTRFVLPVLLDRIDKPSATVPPAFRGLQWTDLFERKATPEFVDFIKAEYRRRQLRPA